jgi:transposase
MDVKSTRQRRKFTVDFRCEAAHLVIDTGRPIVEVAREVNVGPALLGRWVAKERAVMGGGPDAPLDIGERAELERLRKENQALRMENEFLGKASAFFAAKSQSRNVSR